MVQYFSRKAQINAKKLANLYDHDPALIANKNLIKAIIEKINPAVSNYKKAIKLKKDYRLAFSGLGRLLLKKGCHKGGLKMLGSGDGIISFDVLNGLTIK